LAEISPGIGFADIAIGMSYDWRQAQLLLGQTAREIGVLVLVFAPLESTFSDRSIDASTLVGSIVVSLVLVAGGILIEAQR
jgi:hypothetical protein